MVLILQSVSGHGLSCKILANQAYVVIYYETRKGSPKASPLCNDQQRLPETGNNPGKHIASAEAHLLHPARVNEPPQAHVVGMNMPVLVGVE